MIHTGNRHNPAFIEAYQNAQKAAQKAKDTDPSSANYPAIKTAEGEGLAIVSDMLPNEVARIAELAETGTELLAELVGLIFRTATPVHNGIRISSTDLFSSIADNMPGDYLTVSTGIVLDDLAASFDQITEKVKGKKDLLAEARKCLKTPNTWNEIAQLATLSLRKGE